MVFSYQRLKKFFSLNYYPIKDTDSEDLNSANNNAKENSSINFISNPGNLNTCNTFSHNNNKLNSLNNKTNSSKQNLETEVSTTYFPNKSDNEVEAPNKDLEYCLSDVTTLIVKRNGSISLVSLPFIYFIIHMVTLVLLLIYKKTNDIQRESDLIISNQITTAKIDLKVNFIDKTIAKEESQNKINMDYSKTFALNKSNKSIKSTQTQSKIKQNISASLLDEIKNDSKNSKRFIHDKTFNSQSKSEFKEKHSNQEDTSNKSQIQEKSSTQEEKKNLKVIIENSLFSYKVVYCFFDLLTVNVELFFISSCLTSFIGLIILIIFYSILKQRYNVPEFKSKFINLYIMVTLGVLTIFMNFLIGFFPFYLKYTSYFEMKNLFNNHIGSTENGYVKEFGVIKDNKIFEEIDKENQDISIKGLLFMSYICIAILYSISIISNIQLLKNIKIAGKTSASSNEYKFYHKIIILIVIVFFTTFYVLCLLQKNHSINFDFAFFENKILIYLVPYFIYIFLGILMFSFYFELNYITFRMSRNMEVDYLFENEVFRELEKLENKN